MELTKEHFDKAIKGLATQQSLEELAERVGAVEQTLASHTVTLDAIAKNTTNWNAEMASLREALRRHEHAFRILAAKVGVNVDDLLSGDGPSAHTA